MGNDKNRPPQQGQRELIQKRHMGVPQGPRIDQGRNVQDSAPRPRPPIGSDISRPRKDK